MKLSCRVDFSSICIGGLWQWGWIEIVEFELLATAMLLVDGIYNSGSTELMTYRTDPSASNPSAI